MVRYNIEREFVVIVRGRYFGNFIVVGRWWWWCFDFVCCIGFVSVDVDGIGFFDGVGIVFDSGVRFFLFFRW